MATKYLHIMKIKSSADFNNQPSLSILNYLLSASSTEVYSKLNASATPLFVT